MPTKIGEVGVTFPDNTVQTTAAIAGAPGFGGGYSQLLKTFSGTYLLPSNVNAVRVTIMSGGGGGGAVNSNAYGGSGGGGSGSSGYVVITRASLLLNYPTGQIPYVVGQGGASATNGGASSFGNFITATGGTAGTTAIYDSRYSVASPGGPGGSCTTGNFYYGTGATGGTGTPYSQYAYEAGGNGAAITYGYLKGLPGAGGYIDHSQGNVSGSPGTLWGAGGGGSAKGSGGGGFIAGAAGSPGIVIIEEFY